MQKILTVKLLDKLINLGYRYFLSRTTIIQGQDADICTMLIPVKHTPELKKLPAGFDKYFRIDEEPRQMAAGVDATIVLVDLSEMSNKDINGL